jgi:transposase
MSHWCRTTKGTTKAAISKRMSEYIDHYLVVGIVRKPDEYSADNPAAFHTGIVTAIPQAAKTK